VRVGPYEVLETLARGGMGVVLRCRGPEGQQVAVKVLLRPDAGRTAERFSREARLQSGLGELEGFVPLLDAGTCPEGPFLVMPLAGGGDLRHRLAKGPLPESEARRIVAALARSMGRAHAQGIVHRDLKPENVLFTSVGRPLVADLGLAKHFRHDLPGASQSVSLSREGVLMGTVGYMAPEQAHDARGVGPPADVFALGAILYECLTGEAAFQGQSGIEVLARVQAGTWTPVEELNPEVPRDLRRVIARALSSDPAQRYQDADALADALLAPPSVELRQLAPALAVGALVVACLVGVGAWAALSPPGADAETPPGADAEVVVAAAPPNPTPDLELGPEPSAPGPEGFGLRHDVVLPPQCREFLESEHTLLRAVWGSYDFRHAGPVTAVGFLPDGRVVSTSEDFSARVWSPLGEELARLVEPQSIGYCLTVTPSGNVLVGAQDGHVREWNPLQAGWVRDLPLHSAPVTWLKVLEGSVLASGSMDRTHRYHRLEGEPEPAVLRLGSPITSVSRPGAGVYEGRMLVGMQSGRLELFGMRDGDSQWSAEAHSGAVTSAVLLPDGRAVSGGIDGRVILWDPARDVALALLEGHEGAVVTLATFGEGRYLLSGGVDRTVRWWDLQDRGRLLETYTVHTGWVNALATSADGAWAVSGSADHTLRMWDLRGPRPEPLLPAGEEHLGQVTDIVRVAGGQLVSAGADQRLLRWSGAGQVLDARGDFAAWPTRLGTDVSGAIVVGGDWEGGVRLWDLSSPDGDQVLVARTGQRCLGVSVSAAGVIIASQQNMLSFWPRDRQRRSSPAVSPAPGVAVIATSPDYLVGGGTDGRVTRGRGYDWNEEVLTTHSSTVTAVAAFGDLVLSADEQGGVKLSTGQGSRTLRPPGAPVSVSDAAISADGRLGATCGRDRVVRLWDLERGFALDEIDLSGSGDVGKCVEFSIEGDLLVGTARGVILQFELRP
jgi:eukaryotic-like serine/threonine-protein kinase